jgi:hypothetical protein
MDLIKFYPMDLFKFYLMDLFKFYGILFVSTPWIYLNFMEFCQSVPYGFI